jgi:exonuclease SbcD
LQRSYQINIKILHTSDVHLGGDEAFPNRWGTQGAELTLTALSRIVDATATNNVSVLLIAGDFFDNNRVQDSWIDAAIQEFRRCRVPVIIVPGNHDCAAPDSVYRRAALEQAVEGLRVIYDPLGETIQIPSLELAVWGKAIPDYEGDYRPLSGMPPAGTDRWQVAVGHGYFTRDGDRETFNYPISSKEIMQSCRDYVALGHQDLFQKVNDAPVVAYYSGSASRTGHAALVELSEAGAQVSQCPL